MPFLQIMHFDDGHHHYVGYPNEGSPYARPEKIERQEGETWVPYSGEASALAALRAKRLPWDIDPEKYREDWLSGGHTFPAGDYRITMENVMTPLASLPEGTEFPFPYFSWMYALERRPHAWIVDGVGDFQWTRWPIYGHTHAENASIMVNTVQGFHVVSANWESYFNEHGCAVLCRFWRGTRVAALITRTVWVWKDESIPDWNQFQVDAALQNGVAFKRRITDATYINFGNDGPH